MKAVLTTLTLATTMALATAAIAGPGDMRSFPYGPVATFSDQGRNAEAPYSLTGSTRTSNDALRPMIQWIGGSRTQRTVAVFSPAR